MSRFDPREHAIYKRDFTVDVIEWADEMLSRGPVTSLLDLAAKVRDGRIAPPDRPSCRDEARYALWNVPTTPIQTDAQEQEDAAADRAAVEQATEAERRARAGEGER